MDQIGPRRPSLPLASRLAQATVDGEWPVFVVDFLGRFSMPDIVILDGVRTPMAEFNGSFSDVS
ncbi:MAG TPA: hypothetical protein VOA00_12085, partial [Thermoanaerobaculia bacterium]|nr:hypothetical protein [Thermoanaerobaculia bacterium]